MSNRLVGLIVAAALVVVGAVGAVVLARGDGAYAFKVGTREVSQESVDGELSVLHDNEQLASVLVQQQVAALSEGSIPAPVTGKWIGLVRIPAEFFRQALERRGGRVTPADRAAVGLPTTLEFQQLPRDFRRDLIEYLAVVQAAPRVIASQDKQLESRVRASCPSGRYVSHILVETQQEAADLKRQLDAGASFPALARGSSIDGSAQQDGELGCIEGQSFVEPFASVAAAQQVGVVSEPFQTEFGFHILLVSDRPLETDLRAAALSALVQRFQAASVTVDPRYGEWDAPRLELIPPAVPTP